MRVMTANNDALIRVFDAKSFTCVDNFSFPWSANVSISYLYYMKYIYKRLDVAIWADMGVVETVFGQIGRIGLQ